MSRYSGDYRLAQAIDTARRYAAGRASSAELDAAAQAVKETSITLWAAAAHARNATWNATQDTAWKSAQEAAWESARAAQAYFWSVGLAPAAAAWSAERYWQQKRLASILGLTLEERAAVWSEATKNTL
jgi:hypothetical protein